MTCETGLQVLQQPIPFKLVVKKNEKPRRSGLTFAEFSHPLYGPPAVSLSIPFYKYSQDIYTVCIIPTCLTYLTTVDVSLKLSVSLFLPLVSLTGVAELH